MSPFLRSKWSSTRFRLSISSCSLSTTEKWVQKMQNINPTFITRHWNSANGLTFVRSVRRLVHWRHGSLFYAFHFSLVSHSFWNFGLKIWLIGKRRRRCLVFPFTENNKLDIRQITSMDDRQFLFFAIFYTMHRKLIY